VDEKAKVNASYYVTMGRCQKYTPKPTIIAEQIEDCLIDME